MMSRTALVALVALAGTCSALSAPRPSKAAPLSGTSQAPVNRRGALFGALSAFLAAPALAEYKLPDLPYPYEALEPHIDAATMRFHHDKHHATYVANVNKAVAGKPEMSILELQKDAIAAGPGVRNSGGGHYNHALFWDEMGPASGKGPSGELASKIDEAFGSFDKFKEEFSTKAAGRFGSGWCWLGVKPDGALAIDTTPNQDNPLMKGGCETDMVPILGLDVWEHAYYLKYQNRRPEYIAAWFNVIDWDKVASNYEKYAKKGNGIPF